MAATHCQLAVPRLGSLERHDTPLSPSGVRNLRAGIPAVECWVQAAGGHQAAVVVAAN